MSVIRCQYPRVLDEQHDQERGHDLLPDLCSGYFYEYGLDEGGHSEVHDATILRHNAHFALTGWKKR